MLARLHELDRASGADCSRHRTAEALCAARLKGSRIPVKNRMSFGLYSSCVCRDVTVISIAPPLNLFCFELLSAAFQPFQL